jgi:FtsP/CotA-like multicopper oxidase with cupredoxin domain
MAVGHVLWKCTSHELTRRPASPPPIQVDSNDTLIVHAYNGLDEPSSIHHHGMFFNSTSWMDGAMSITQW